MAATTSQQYRRLRQQRVADTAGAASGIVTDMKRWLNNAHAYRLRPIVCPGHAWIGAPGYAVSTSSTAEVYGFPMGRLACPTGYSTLRYAICAERTSGSTTTATLTLRLARELYRGPRSGTFDQSYIAAGSKALAHSISGGGVFIFTGTTNAISYAGSTASRPYLGTQTGLAYIYPWITIQAAASAAHTWTVWSIAMALEEGTGSISWQPFDDTPQQGQDASPSSNRQPAAAGELLAIVERLNICASALPRCIWNMNLGTLPASVSALTPALQTQYWDGRRNFTSIVSHYICMPDEKSTAGTTRQIRSRVEANVDVTTQAWATGADRVRPYSYVELQAGETVSATPSDAANPIIVSENSVIIEASTGYEVPQTNPGSGLVWIDPARFAARRGIYDADWEELRSILDQALYEYRPTIVACSVRDPTNVSIPRTFRLSSTHGTNYRSLITGVYPETYGTAKPGWPTWSTLCARGVATTATVHCWVWARVLSDTETGTLRVETQAGSGTLALAANTPTMSWRGPVAVAAKADSTGTYPSYGDWLQAFCRADDALEAGEFIDIGAFVAYLTGVT